MSKKFAIIIPTYLGHKEQVELFLKSYQKLCSDPQAHKIFLIVSSSETQIFKSLLEDLDKDIQIEVVSLKKIIKQLEMKTVNEEELLKQVGKFNFQAIKKMYGAQYTGADTNLILDSEALLIRQTNFSQIFTNFLKKPFVFYSPYFANQMQQDVTYLACHILGKPALNKWFLETQYWFFQKHVLLSLQKYVKKQTGSSIFENFKTHQPIFPEIFYFVYLYYFHKKEATFVNAENLLQNTLSTQNYLEYRSRMVGNTIFEYFSWGINKNTWKSFKKILEKYKIVFFKYDDRWQVPGNVFAQQQLIQETKSIKLLPCRVVTKTFSVGSETVPKNHDAQNNEPIMFSRKSLRSLLWRKIKSVSIVRLAHQYYVGWRENHYIIKSFARIVPLFDKYDSIHVFSKKTKGTFKINKKLAFDVGAFTGNSLPRLRSLGFEQIICFEPSRRNFVHLYENAKMDTNIGFIHRAVSSKSEKVLTFYSNQFLPWLNTLHPDWLNKTRHAPDVKNVSVTQIKTTTLDDVIDRVGQIPAYIKIDTEGHEHDSLLGLSYKPDLLSYEWISERKKSTLACLDRCQKLGFTKYYVELGETVPEFNEQPARTYSEAREYILEIKKFDKKNNLGGNLWCQ